MNPAVDLATKVLEVESELDLPHRHPTVYYSDSKDVLAWIQNEHPNENPKRYEVSRINKIRKLSNPDQWQYIPTHHNPADIGTRPISAKDLQTSCWLTGPPFLLLEDPKPPNTSPPKSINNTNLFTAHASSYFLTHNRHATEEITSGSAWESRLKQTQQKHKHPTF